MPVQTETWIYGDATVYGNLKVEGEIEGSHNSETTTITKEDIGLGNVDNTSDLSKPISTATQNALNSKADAQHSHELSDIVGIGDVASINTAGNTTTYLRGDGSWAVPNNTTYPLMTQSQLDGGTSTAAQTVSPKLLSDWLGSKGYLTSVSIEDVQGLLARLDDLQQQIDSLTGGADG